METGTAWRGSETETWGSQGGVRELGAQFEWKAGEGSGQQQTSAGQLKKAVSLHVFGSQALGEPWGPGTELGLLLKRNRKRVKSFKDRDMTCSAARKGERVPAAAWVVQRVRGGARRYWGYLVVWLRWVWGEVGGFQESFAGRTLVDWLEVGVRRDGDLDRM